MLAPLATHALSWQLNDKPVHEIIQHARFGNQCSRMLLAFYIWRVHREKLRDHEVVEEVDPEGGQKDTDSGCEGRLQPTNVRQVVKRVSDSAMDHCVAEVHLDRDFDYRQLISLVRPDLLRFKPEKRLVFQGGHLVQL